ncbi:hypothetical protein ABN226_18685, partial [Morganella morganii]|uniref:hypothetical protein n=1 Tax=Morganella morganii TaxID=582 RepID=UPI0032D9F75A
PKQLHRILRKHTVNCTKTYGHAYGRMRGRMVGRLNALLIEAIRPYIRPYAWPYGWLSRPLFAFFFGSSCVRSSRPLKSILYAPKDFRKTLFNIISKEKQFTQTSHRFKLNYKHHDIKTVKEGVKNVLQNKGII